MQPLLFYKISISYHIFQGKKRGFEKTTKSIFFLIASPERRRWAAKPLGGVFLCLAGLYKSTFQNFFTWHTAQPQFPHPHNFYLAHGTRASSEKSPDNFCSPFSKNASEKFDFRPNRNFSDGNFRKGVQKQTGFDFFLCRVPGVFCLFYVFRPLPQSACIKIRAFCLHEIFRCAIMLFGNTEPPVPCAR